MTGRPFRFGVVASRAGSGEEWAATARRVESLGYSTLAMPDRLQHTLAPIPALAAAAAATSRLRVGTYVIANDFRDPVLLAKETATLDLLSGGRFELGVGIGLAAGASADGRMLGLAPASARERTERLAEALPLVKALWEGRAVIAGGRHYVARDAEVSPSPTQRPRPPILVAAWSRRLLELAAREADIVALGVPPAEARDGVAERVGWLREASGGAFDRLELNINLMAVGDRVPSWAAQRMGVSARALAESGAVAALVGTPEEMRDVLLRRREDLGLSYVVVSDELMEALAPVVERLAGV